jgi:hypothetical protein
MLGMRIFVRTICEDRNRQRLPITIRAIHSSIGGGTNKTSGCPIASSDGPLDLKAISTGHTTANFDASGHTVSSKHSLDSRIALAGAPVLLGARLPYRCALLPF